MDATTAEFMECLTYLYDEGFIDIFPDPVTGEPVARIKTQAEILAEIESL